ncbi:MAG: hypothetical protein M5R42_21780, partial [Rhodocyclaceae bacterium]|nr:hypothetical protein [Rhodocyclaceae bacterium]
MAHFEGMQITPPQRDWLHRGAFLGKSSHLDANPVPLHQQPGIPICTTPEHHTLIVARTRTGRRHARHHPDIAALQRLNGGDRPQGRNAAVTARPPCLFAKVTDKVHVINPWGELAAVCQKGGISQD